MYRLIVLFNDTATTEIYTYQHTLSLHDALPIWRGEQGLAQQEGQGIRTRRNLVLVLQQRELDRTSRQIEQETGRKYVLPQRGELIEGIYRRAVMVGAQRYAMIERAHEFSLVPWRPVLDRAVGQSVSGIMPGGPISRSEEHTSELPSLIRIS